MMVGGCLMWVVCMEGELKRREIDVCRQLGGEVRAGGQEKLSDGSVGVLVILFR